MNSLTKREKILLIVGASVLVLFVAFNYLIIPAYNKYVEKSDLFTELEFEKIQIEEKIASKPSVEIGYNRTLEEYTDLAKHFPEEMTSYELDRMITNICKQHDMKPTYLSIPSTPADDSVAVTNVTLKVSVSTNYMDLQRFINTINNTDYIQISAFNYVVKDGGIDVDMDFNVQMLSLE